ncbi:MAG: ATP-binding protein [Terriglobia bacterium]
MRFPALIKPTLRVKLMSWTALLLCLVTLLLVFMGSRKVRLVLSEENRLRGIAIARLFGATNVNYLKSYQLLPIQQNAVLAKTENHLSYVVVYDKEGRVVAHTEDPALVMRLGDESEIAQLSPSREVLFRDNIQPPFPHLPKDRYFEVFLRITAPESSKNWGTVRLGISSRPLEKSLHETRWYLFLLGLGVLALGLAGAASLATHITTPIQELTKASQQAAQGDLAIRPQVHTGDEIETLAENFSHMIEEIRRHQEARIRVEKAAAIGQLVNTIVHDCRTPLTVIKGYVSFLNEFETSPEKQRDSLQVIQREVERLEGMVDEMLDYPSTGKVSLVLEPVSLNDFVAECCEEIQALLHGTPIQLVQRLRANGSVQLDRGQMRRAILNLVANARDAMPEGGTLLMETETHDSNSLIRISDSGSGIPADLQARLFEPFFTHGKIGGHGLGMSITKRIVEDHGGQISFHSAQGQGTSFTITVPAQVNQAKSASA